MSQSERYVLFFMVFVWSIFFEKLLTIIFPYSELAGLTNYPIAILLCVASCFIIFFVSRSVKKRWLFVTIIIAVVLIQNIIQMALLPQSRDTVFTQIKTYAAAYKNYDNIKYDNFHDLNYAERIAYLHKFKSRLPDKLIFLTITADTLNKPRPVTKLYAIEERYKKLLYDTLKLKISVEADTATLTEINKGVNGNVYVLPIKYIEGPGLYTDKGVAISAYKGRFDIDPGSERTFYNILGWKK